MPEKIYNGVLGQATSTSYPFYNPITFANGSTTTGSWASATTIPTIASGDFIKISVEPGTVNEEIVYLSGPYTGGATSATTFTRAAEDSAGGVSLGAGIAHAAVDWVHTVTAADFIRPFGRINQTGGQSFLVSTITQVTLTSASILRGGMTAGSSGLTVPIAGLYRVTGQVYFQAGTTTARYNGSIRVNNVDATGTDGSANGSFAMIKIHDVLSLAASDILTMFAEQAVGTVNTITSFTFLIAEFIEV